MTRRPHVTVAVALLATALTSLTSLTSGGARAESLSDTFKAANDAYFAGDVDRAIRSYEGLVEAGVEDPDIYYNLAIAHAREDHLGFAVLFLERALALDPRDAAAASALDATRAVLQQRHADRAAGTSMDFRELSVAAQALRGVTADSLAWLVLLFDLGLFASLFGLHLARHETRRLALGLTAPLLALGFLAATCALLIKLDTFAPGAVGVVVGRDVPTYQGPDPRATGRGVLLEGQPVRVLERSGDFSLVETAAGKRAWAPGASVGTIGRGDG